MKKNKSAKVKAHIRTKKTDQKKQGSSFKLSLRKKLVGSFAIVLLLLGGAGGYANYAVTSMDANYSHLMEEEVKTMEDVKELKLEIKQSSNAVRSYLLTGESYYTTEYYASVKRFDKLVNEIESTHESAEVRDMMKKLESVHQKFQDIVKHEIDLRAQNKTSEYLSVLKTTAKMAEGDVNSYADRIIKHQSEALEAQKGKTQQFVSFTKAVVAISCIGAVLIGILLAVYISRIISKPVKKASQALRSVAAGDLTTEEIQVKNRDEIGELAQSLNKMLRDLKHVITQVNISSGQVAASSEQLAASAEQSTANAKQVAEISQRNSQGMEQQLSHFREVSDSVNEMTAGILHISQNSEQMLQATEQAKGTTKQGTESVGHVVHQMTNIHQSVSHATKLIQSLEAKSSEINEIVGMITSIADQTNLLALNAAIEAARAGEHGKGFAVVADEVRKLAEQSRKSAGEITGTIAEIQSETGQAVAAMKEGNQQVTEGMKDTEAVQKAFEHISDSIDGVVSRVEKVASSVSELTEASSHISDAVIVVKEISEKSAAAGQESAAASQEQLATIEEVSVSAHSLSSLAEDLQKAISRFKL
ncbi:methyl-accepting chemotaxis protein [Peribacillus sp. SCS-155]|uniref:methyl-accepting chemotaxis protein n=1 Tax=Peribacillus sedimenti TaxID=3115297 RepID=UPI0039065DF5